MNQITVISVTWARDEIVVIALVVLLLFGGKKIPELMKGPRQGLSRSFKDEDRTTSKRTSNNLNTNSNLNLEKRWQKKCQEERS